MFNFLGRWKTLAFYAMLGCALALLFTTLIGGLLFNLESSTVFSWFTSVLVILFVGTSAIALLLFLLWYFFTKPWVVLPIVAGIVLILCAVILLIKPDATPFLNLEEMLSPYLEFLKK